MLLWSGVLVLDGIKAHQVLLVEVQTSWSVELHVYCLNIVQLIAMTILNIISSHVHAIFLIRASESNLKLIRFLLLSTAKVLSTLCVCHHVRISSNFIHQPVCAEMMLMLWLPVFSAVKVS